MDKVEMRDWVASLEEVLDNKLKKWVKENSHSNGDVVQLRWTFENAHLQLDIFWPDGKELVVLHLVGPRISQEHKWHGLSDKTFNHVMDRVGNLVMAIMHPPVDPSD